MELDAAVDLPIERSSLSLDMALAGERLSGLDDLLDVSLPPWGPYSLKGEFDFQATGYELSDLHLQVGASDLQGDLTLEMAGARPRMEVELTTSRLQIDDFRVGDWSPLDAPPLERPPLDEVPQDEDAADAAGGEDALAAADELHALLSPAAMRSLGRRGSTSRSRRYCPGATISAAAPWPLPWRTVGSRSSR